MRNIKKLVSVFCIVIGLSASSLCAETTLCKTDEIMIASCLLNEKKQRILSLCSSADKLNISYRFGTRSKVELDVIFSNKEPVSRWVDVTTYTTYFGFRLKEYAYVVGIPQERYGATAFLEVTKNDLGIMDRNCVENSFGEKNLRSDAIQDVEDELVRGNKFLFPPASTTSGVGREP